MGMLFGFVSCSAHYNNVNKMKCWQKVSAVIYYWQYDDILQIGLASCCIALLIIKNCSTTFFRLEGPPHCAQCFCFTLTHYGFDWFKFLGHTTQKLLCFVPGQGHKTNNNMEQELCCSGLQNHFPLLTLPYLSEK